MSQNLSLSGGVSDLINKNLSFSDLNRKKDILESHGENLESKESENCEKSLIKDKSKMILIKSGHINERKFASKRRL